MACQLVRAGIRTRGETGSGGMAGKGAEELQQVDQAKGHQGEEQQEWGGPHAYGRARIKSHVDVPHEEAAGLSIDYFRRMRPRQHRATELGEWGHGAQAGETETRDSAISLMHVVPAFPLRPACNPTKPAPP